MGSVASVVKLSHHSAAAERCGCNVELKFFDRMNRIYRMVFSLGHWLCGAVQG